MQEVVLVIYFAAVSELFYYSVYVNTQENFPGTSSMSSFLVWFSDLANNYLLKGVISLERSGNSEENGESGKKTTFTSFEMMFC